MFPIARALVGLAEHGGKFVKPTIRQIKIGPVIRGERDWRTYGNIMRGRTTDDWKLWASSRLRRSISQAEYTSQEGVTIVYEGLGRQFHDFAAHRDLIYEYLRKNAIGIEAVGSRYDVAIHIRRGDFSVGGNHSGQNIQTPISWYRNAWEEARDALGLQEPRVILFTDYDPEVVQAELDLPSVKIDRSANALISIMKMTQADLIIGSRSSFSLWGAFLGGGQAIWPKQFDLGRYKPIDENLDKFL